jgi:general secretion pathway protein C
MEALLKKYFWAVKLFGFAFAAALAASAITTQIGTKMLLVDSEDEAAADEAAEDEEEDEDGLTFKDNPFQAKAASGQKNRHRLSQTIIERNIFCPLCAPQELEQGPQAFDEDGRPLGPVILPGEVRSSLPLKLMATMESSDPKYSFATIFDEEAGIAGLYGQDDVIRAGVMVTGVDRGLVHIRNNAALEYIELASELEKPKAKASSSKKKKKKKNSRAIPGAAEAINCPSDNLCVVERTFVEKLMANPALLAKQARVVPSVKDGETVGFKFYGIRRGSLPRLLGLRNGDLLTQVNGEDLTSMDKAMQLYTKLRRASNLSITIQRKGKTMNKEVQIK